MNWARAPLRVVARPEPSAVRLDADDVVWHLSLDQIESHSGRLLNRVMKRAGDAGPSTFVFDDGNVLYAKLRPYLNKVICPDEVGISTTEMVPLRPNPNAILRRFLLYYLRSDRFVRFASQAVAGVKMPRVMMDRFWAHEVPLPGLSEQRRIVEILDQADRLRQLRRAADEKAQRIIPALFYKMFGDPATNPKGWPVGKMGDVILEAQYGTSTRASDNGEGIALIRMNNIDTRGELDLSNLKYVILTNEEAAKYRLEAGDLLFNRTNSRELVGKTGLWHGQMPAVAASYLIRVRVNRDAVLPEYAWAYMNCPFVKQLLLNKARRAIGMANINARELRSLPIVIPDLHVQRTFVARLEEARSLARQMEDVAQEVRRTLDTLFHRAFTGDLTAQWREAHREQLEAELREQLAALERARTERPRRGRGSATPTGSAAGEPERHAGHDMFNKAALVTYIVDRCHDRHRPHALGRTKLAKLFYLVQRRAEVALTQQFARRAAGPLDDTIHKFLNLAKKRGWLELPPAEGQLKPVVPGRDPRPALDHVRQRWSAVLPAIDQMLDTMKGWGWEALERWATVLHVAENLLAEGKALTPATVKAAIAACPEWRPKLDRAAFSDADIQSTLAGLRRYGFLPGQSAAKH